MYHLRNGIFLGRTENGEVRIQATQPGAITVSPSEWASAVAAVSASGETGETHQAALDFHNGDPENAHGGRW